MGPVAPPVTAGASGTGARRAASARRWAQTTERRARGTLLLPTTDRRRYHELAARESPALHLPDRRRIRFPARYPNGRPSLPPARSSARSLEQVYEIVRQAYTRRPVAARSKADPLAPFGPAVRAWFEATFEAPTPAQAEGWAAISQGRHTLIHAPTGSGKTLAAFLWCLDRLVREPSPPRQRGSPGTVRTLYVSPLKALTYDVERNLRAPLAGIALAAQRLGEEPPRISIASRTGDTPAGRAAGPRPPPAGHPRHDAREPVPPADQPGPRDPARRRAGDRRRGPRDRRDQARRPPGAQPRAAGAPATAPTGDGAASPSSGSASARPSARSRPSPGSSAGSARAARSRSSTPARASRSSSRSSSRSRTWRASARSCRWTSSPAARSSAASSAASIWPAIHPRILELIREHHSTIVFTNSRRLAERLAQRLNELAGEELVRAHHGSIAREQRLEIEEELKAGRLPALVATSSLELGIDMGAVDLVIQVESPTSGRPRPPAHRPRGPPGRRAQQGRDLPQVPRRPPRDRRRRPRDARRADRADGRCPRNPLDVLAQQIVAMAIGERFTVDELLEIVRRAAPFETLTREVLEGVLGMLAGAYPSDEFAELKPRITWDRLTDVIEGRQRRARRRRHQRRHDPGPRPVPGVPRGRGRDARAAGGRARRGDGLRAAGRDARRRRRPGRELLAGRGHQPQPGDGDPGPGRAGQAAVLARATPSGGRWSWAGTIGAFIARDRGGPGQGAEGPREGGRAPARGPRPRRPRGREPARCTSRTSARRRARCRPTGGSSSSGSATSWATGGWSILTPFGGRVHAPWTLALEARLEERLGLEVQTIYSDDGIAIRLPEGDGSLEGVEELLFPDPDEVEDLVVGRVGGSSLFASRFRENAARALLLPRRRPGTRTPLWQQRQRAADLLVGGQSRYGSFPILVETYRECLADVFDLPALREILGGVQRREVAVHSVETAKASAFAGSLLFDYVAAYMYEGDAPLAERRAQALTLDRDLLRELLGQEELRELLDPDALADLELSLQALAEDRQAKTADQVHDLLRRLGDLSTDEAGGADGRGSRGGVAPPVRAGGVAARGAGADRGRGAMDRDGGRRAVPRRRGGLGAAGRAAGVPRAGGRGAGRAAGAVRPDARAVPGRGAGPALGAAGRAWSTTRSTGWSPPGRCWPASSGRAARSGSSAIRRSCGSCAGGRSRRLRREVEPVDPVTLARFLPAWHGVAASPSATGSGGSPFRGSAALERLAEVVDQLAGLPIPASVLERDVLPARIPGYQPRMLDELGAMGEVAWVGRGSLGRDDGRVVLLRPGREAAAPGRPARRHGAPGGRDPRPPPRAPSAPRRLLLPRAVLGLGGPVGPRGARRALGPRLGRRGHERHVRPAPGPALEAAGKRHATAPRAPDVARPARGRRPLVAGRRRRGRDAGADAARSGSTPRRWSCSSATAS